LKGKPYRKVETQSTRPKSKRDTAAGLLNEVKDMKRLMMVLIVGVALIVTGNVTAFADSGSRIEKLVIEKHVSRAIGKRLDLVTFATGSGWLKLITRDQISPILRFGKVSQDDVRQFNLISEGNGYPFRVTLAGNVLTIRHTRNDGKQADKRIDLAATKDRSLFQLDPQPQIMLARNQSGRICLMEVKGGTDTRLAMK